MTKYWDIIQNAYSGYFNYFIGEITRPAWDNYFYYLIAISLLVWGLEIMFPWRKNQNLFRKDFWQDTFYMFFNFFLFSLIGYQALAAVGVNAFNNFLSLFGIENIVALHADKLNPVISFLIMFLIADLIQWTVHLILHKVPWMWKFHQVHHSVTEMGFSAHLRFHWMETIFYKSAMFIPLTMIGYNLDDLFLMHYFTVMIGHLNHANINWNYGPLKYILNSPHMHIWHHAKQMPSSHPNGINFGITLSIWDYIFGTAHIPESGRDIELGFDDVQNYPESFIGQVKEPFKKK